MKADELWEKYSTIHRGLQYMDEPQFLAALAERDEYVKKECVRVCRGEKLVEPTDSADDIAYDCAVDDCAAAIEKLEIK